MWGSVLGCGGGEKRGWGVWRKVRRVVGFVKKCGRVYGVSVGKCVGEVRREVCGKVRGDVGM